MEPGRAGSALSRGAFTIVNGIASGMGGACGVDLRLASRFLVTDSPGEVETSLLGPGANSHLDDRLVRACALHLLRDAGVEDRFGARVETLSEIPSSRGLKSSSAAASPMARQPAERFLP